MKLCVFCRFEDQCFFVFEATLSFVFSLYKTHF